MNNYVGEIPGLSRVPYVDRKRYLWLLSALFPLIPLVGMGLVLHTGTQWTLWLPLAFVYGVIPLLDALFPTIAATRRKRSCPNWRRTPITGC